MEHLAIGPVPGWGGECAEELIGTLLDEREPFPCTFAVSAARQGSLRFAFVDSAHDQAAWTCLPATLATYLACAAGVHQHTSLVVLFRPDPQPYDLDHYHERFWTLLQYLHDRDPEPWPAGVGRDLDDPWWEFAFRGTPMFVVCNTPAHVRRRSRSGRGVVVTFQPRWVFAGLEAESSRGQAARRTIRDRLRRFDGMEPAPELGGFGDPDKREWKQYFLPDENGGELPRCPFRLRERSEP